MVPQLAGRKNGPERGHGVIPRIGCLSDETGYKDRGLDNRVSVHGECYGYGGSGLV